MKKSVLRRAGELVTLASCLAGCSADHGASDAVQSGGSAGAAQTGVAGAGGSAGTVEVPRSLGGRGSPVVAPACARFVTSALDHAFGPGQSSGQAAFPTPILGPPRGGGSSQGSLDVVSLGNGGHVTLAFGGSRIVDGPGPDFIVFENPFYVAGDPTQPFAELARVEVSADGQSWVGFPCAQGDETSCAGWNPVLANVDENDLDPTDPAVAGGDAFDLEDVGVPWARYVRITDRLDLVGANGVFDLDAVAIVNVECP